jgi:bacteriorhodopsin
MTSLVEPEPTPEPKIPPSPPGEIEIERQDSYRPSIVSSESVKIFVDIINQKVEKHQTKNLELHNPRLTHISHQVVWVTFCLFTIAALVLGFLSLTHAHAESFVTTFFVTSIAAASYFAKAVGMGDLIAFGVRVPFVRYVDWICTTPMMLYELCLIGDAPQHVTMMVIGCDLLMLSFGIVAACLDRRKKLVVKYVWFALSCAFYSLMVFSLHKDIANGSALDQPPDVRALFSRLEWLTICAWSLYPVVVILGRAHAGLISKPSEDMCLCALDCIAKIGMEGLIVASCSAPDAMCHASGGEEH